MNYATPSYFMELIMNNKNYHPSFLSDKPECHPSQRVKYGVTLGKSVDITCLIHSNPRVYDNIILSHGDLKYSKPPVYDENNVTLASITVSRTIR